MGMPVTYVDMPTWHLVSLHAARMDSYGDNKEQPVATIRTASGANTIYASDVNAQVVQAMASALNADASSLVLFQVSRR